MADSEAQIKLQERLNQLKAEGQLSDQESLEIARQFANAADRSVAAMTKMLSRIESVKRAYQGVDDVQKRIVDNEHELIDIVSTLQRDLVKNRHEFEGIGKKASDVTSILVQQYKLQMQQGKLSKKTGELLIADAKATAQIARNMEAIAGSDLAPIFQETMNYASSIADNIESVFSSIPGGNIIFKALGGDQLKQQLQAAASQGMAAIGKSLQAGAGPLQALRAGMLAFNAAVMANPFVLTLAAIAAAVVVIKKLVSFAADFEKESRETAKNMGITVAQATQLRKEAMATSTEFGTQLARTEDILAVQQESANAFGTTAMMSADTARNIADIGKSFGYGAEQAAKVNTAFVTMGASSDQAVSMQRELAAEALKAGVNVGTVTADIAENAGATAKFFGGNVKALKKAAIEAAKMGVSLATMAKVSDSLLDFESSIASQFEFQALTGKQINLDKARQLALEGDIAGATKEVLSNVGSVSEFNDMDYLARKKLAEATGMEVDELQKSLIIQERLGDLTEEQKAAMAGLNLSAAELNDLSDKELQTKLAQQQAADKSAKAFDDLKTQLASALLPLGEALMQVFSLLSPIIKILGVTLKIAFSPLTAAGKAISDIVDRFYAVYDAVSMIFSGDITEGFKKLGSTIIDGLLAPLQYSWDVIAGIADAFGFDIGADLGDMASSAIGLTSVGDLAIGANGGPIVASPREGTIFQGTVNDEIAMGPGVIARARGEAEKARTSAVNVVSDQAIAQATLNVLQDIKALLSRTPEQDIVLQVDGQKLGRAIRTADSFRKG